MAASGTDETSGFIENLGPRPNSPAVRFNSNDTGSVSLQTTISLFTVLQYCDRECTVYMAVSYTHLDVYKRQHIFKSNRPMTLEILILVISCKYFMYTPLFTYAG